MPLKLEDIPEVPDGSECLRVEIVYWDFSELNGRRFTQMEEDEGIAAKEVEEKKYLRAKMFYLREKKPDSLMVYETIGKDGKYENPKGIKLHLIERLSVMNLEKTMYKSK